MLDNKETGFLVSKMPNVIKKLGTLGTISYIGAAAIFVAMLFIDFNDELFKGASLLTVGVGLLIYSGVVYTSENKQETLRVVAALETLREVYNRLAEQTHKTETSSTELITRAINDLPNQIPDIIRKVRNT